MSVSGYSIPDNNGSKTSIPLIKSLSNTLNRFQCVDVIWLRPVPGPWHLDHIQETLVRWGLYSRLLDRVYFLSEKISCTLTAIVRFKSNSVTITRIFSVYKRTLKSRLGSVGRVKISVSLVLRFLVYGVLVLYHFCSKENFYWDLRISFSQN